MAIALLTPSFWVPLLLMASPIVASQATPKVSQLFQFTYPTSVQNLLPLPNGCLLLSTSDTSNLYYLNPEAIYPAAQNVITLPNSVALSDMVALGDGLYAINSGGTPAVNAEGGMHIHVVEVATEGNVNVTLDHSIPILDSSSAVGMVALPKYPRTILVADSWKGRIVRIDTINNTTEAAFEDAALQLGTNRTAPGVRGLNIRDGHLYFTNSGQRTYGRFPIDDQGCKTGDVEILAHLDANDESVASYDGFSFDSEGNAFVAVHPGSIHKIAPNGSQTMFVGGADSKFLEPTSVVISDDGKSMYVSTGGRNTGYPISGGQIMKVQI
ncbi:hypothetical protein GGS21DRAFT_485906 [Xylaria nigripes]|nr:hypothetical protein GGS21DRAFT_485906 [Xylaria nigripes]